MNGVLLVSEDVECTSTALTYFAAALQQGADLVVCDAVFGYDGGSALYQTDQHLPGQRCALLSRALLDRCRAAARGKDDVLELLRLANQLAQKNLFTAMPAFLTPFEDVRSQTGWNTDAFSSLSCLPMFHISAMTSLVSWSITGHCVNLCNDLKYFYRDLGAMRSDVMAVVPVLLKSIYHDVMKLSLIHI